MEVTKTIDRQKLRDDFQKVRELKQQVHRYCWCSLSKAQELGALKLEDYCTKRGMPLEDARKLARNLRDVVLYNDLEPRFYYFAYSTSWSDTKTICQNIFEASEEFGVHLHGMLILDRGFFHRSSGFGQVVYHYIQDLDEAFALFMHSIIDSLMTFTKIPEGTSIPLDIYQGVTHSKHETYVPAPVGRSQHKKEDPPVSAPKEPL